MAATNKNIAKEIQEKLINQAKYMAENDRAQYGGNWTAILPYLIGAIPEAIRGIKELIQGKGKGLLGSEKKEKGGKLRKQFEGGDMSYDKKKYGGMYDKKKYGGCGECNVNINEISSDEEMEGGNFPGPTMGSKGVNIRKQAHINDQNVQIDNIRGGNILDKNKDRYSKEHEQKKLPINSVQGGAMMGNGKKLPAKLNNYVNALKEYRKEHPEISYREAQINVAKSFKNMS